MSSWGTGLYCDDLAEDVRDDYREYAAFFENEKEIERRIFEKNKKSLELDEERPVFYYVLADCQWKGGRLGEEVKKQALYYIDHPEEDGNLQLWKENANSTEDPREKKVYLQWYNERKKVLQKLKEKLLSPMPAMKKRKIRTGKPALFEVGDIVRVELDNKAFQRFWRKEKECYNFFSEEAWKKIEKLFDGNHFYMIKVKEKKYLIDDRFFKGREDDETCMYYVEYFSLFDWAGKEELSLEQISQLTVPAIPDFERDGEIHAKAEPDNPKYVHKYNEQTGKLENTLNENYIEREPEYEYSNLFCVSHYELCYPDWYSHMEGRYFKVSQMKKVYNKKELIPEESNARDELLRNAIIWFSGVYYK